MPKWRNFTTSGHTALKQSFILTFFLLGYGGWLSGKRLEPETRDLVVLNESAKFLVQMIIKGPEFESQCQIQGGCFSNWFAVTNCTYCSDWKTRNQFGSKQICCFNSLVCTKRRQIFHIAFLNTSKAVWKTSKFIQKASRIVEKQFSLVLWKLIMECKFGTIE